MNTEEENISVTILPYVPIPYRNKYQELEMELTILSKGRLGPKRKLENNPVLEADN